MISVAPRLVALALLLAAPFGLAQDGPPPAQPAQAPTAAFEAIQSKVGEFRTAQNEQQQRRVLDEIFTMSGAFLDTHAAAATKEQFLQVAGYWFELSDLLEATEQTKRDRLAQLRALPNLPPELAQHLNQVENKLNLKEGAPAPAWSGVDVMDGSAATLEGLRGKLVLMDFWATWCGPCQQLMRDRLAPLHARYGADERFTLVGIGLPWRGETAEREKDFAERNDYHWKKVFDASGDAGTAYGVDGIPFLCLADGEGNIVVIGSGFEVIDRIEAALRERLGPGREPAPPPAPDSEFPPVPPTPPGGG